MTSQRWTRASSQRGQRFSLGEAARIQRDILWGAHPLCPRCRASMNATATPGAGGLSVVSCPVCDVSVVVESPAEFQAQGT